MAEKRYTPETLLASVIARLEHDRRGEHYSACLALLVQGPFMCGDAVLRAVTAARVDDPLGLRTLSPDLVALIRAELLAYIRSVVRMTGTGQGSAPTGIYHPVAFSGMVTGRKTTVCEADGDLRDLIVLQTVVLVMQVGLSNIRICSAPECPHLYVRHYRREFCSRRCQRRCYMRARRDNERRQRERQRRRRHTERSGSAPARTRSSR